MTQFWECKGPHLGLLTKEELRAFPTMESIVHTLLHMVPLHTRSLKQELIPKKQFDLRAFAPLYVIVFLAILDQYIGDYMVSIINIYNGIKELTHGYQNCDTNHILIFGRYLGERIFIYWN